MAIRRFHRRIRGLTEGQAMCQGGVANRQDEESPMPTVFDPVPDAELVLYHAWLSSASRRVRFALEEKELPYIPIMVRLLKSEQNTPEYLRLNPNGVVPTLVHKGRPIIESTAINEYLDDVYPERPLRPSDPVERARMRVWTFLSDQVAIKGFQVLNWNRMMGPTASQWSDKELAEKLAATPMPERREQWRRVAREPFTEAERAGAAESLRHMLGQMERDLALGPWLAGSELSLADINMAPYAVRFGELAERGITLDAFPRVADWWQRLSARPAFARAKIEPVQFS
jgi:glutathione S-transferase